MAGTGPATRRCIPAWPKDALRMTFGVIWLIDAILKWLPGFRSDYTSVILGRAQGQPGWLRPWSDFWITLQHPRVMFFAYLVAEVRRPVQEQPVPDAQPGLVPRPRSAEPVTAGPAGQPPA